MIAQELYLQLIGQNCNSSDKVSYNVAEIVYNPLGQATQATQAKYDPFMTENDLLIVGLAKIE